MRDNGRRYAHTQRGMEKPSRQKYRRDPEFAKFLAKELGMESTPASYRRALRRAYLELPRDMPVRRRPLRSALKALATVAALVIIAGASLLGANRVYPQLTESLPGLGMVFKTINGTNMEQQIPAPLPVDALPGETEDVAEAYRLPAFDPVTLQCLVDGAPSDIGDLTLENAWSDGDTVWLDVSMQADFERFRELTELGGEEAYRWPNYLCAFLNTGYDPTVRSQGEDLEDYTLSSATVNGEPAAGFIAYFLSEGSYNPHTGTLMLQLDEESLDGKTVCYKALWELFVPENARDRDTLEISLDMSHMYFLESVDSHLPLGMGFAGGCTVVADRADGIELGGAQDNGVVLENVAYSPTKIEMNLDVPFMGYYDYGLLPVKYDDTYMGSETPYGLYAVLEGPGELLYKGSLWVGGEPQYNEERQRLQFTSLPISALIAPKDREILTLTLYQYDLDNLKVYARKLGLPQEEVKSMVAAEFTIDLASQTVTPSEGYKEKGLQKLDAATALTSRFHPDFENGIYCREYHAAQALWEQAEVELCIDPESKEGVEAAPHLALYGYMGGELVRAVYASENLDLYSYNTDVGQDVYDCGDGYFWKETGKKFQYQERYWALHFAVRYPDWVEWDAYGPDQAFDRIELVDTRTGQVLVEDVSEACRLNQRATLSGSAYRQASASPTPEASPQP